MAEKTEKKQTASNHKVRIVLVDDHEIVRRGIASLIGSDPGMEVVGEADGVNTALEVIGRTRPGLVLVDMSLREGDGLDLLRIIGSRYPDLRTLVLSMHDEGIYAERALRAGARGYVRKVDLAETIMQAIAQVLTGEVYVSSEVSAAMVRRVSLGKRASATLNTSALSDRELQIVRCIGRGMSNREIADELAISVKTVESHREHIKLKLDLPTSSDLLRYAIEFCRIGG